MSRKFFRITSSILGFTVLVVAFQNCAKEELSFKDSRYDDSLKYFDYKYTSAVPYYYDIKVLRGPIENNVETFQVAGSISKSSPDDNKPISWRIRLIDTDGVPLIPSVEGDNTTNGTLVYVDGLATTVGKTYRTLRIEITYDSETKVYESALSL